MFGLNEEIVQFTHQNNRLEKHGEESVLACDLDFRWETTNGMLALFAPDLRHALYKGSDSAQLELAPDPDHLTSLRFSGLAPLKWGSGELIGGALVFHYGVKSRLEIDASKVHKFKIECKEGGTVVIGFQVQCRPIENQLGKLSKFLTDGACVVSVIPPAEGARGGDGGDLLGGGDDDGE